MLKVNELINKAKHDLEVFQFGSASNEGGDEADIVSAILKILDILELLANKEGTKH